MFGRALVSWVCALALGCSEREPPAPSAPAPEAPEMPVEPAAAPSAEAPVRPDDVSAPVVVEYGDDPVRRAYLYRPDGPGPFPAIVYNHGSEASPPDFRGQARFFVPRGYVLVAPHRRGHGLSSEAAPYPSEVLVRGPVEPAAGALVEVLELQLQDVLGAVEYTRALPYVNRERVSVIGCSLGGVQALLAAERGEGIWTAVDFAGGAITWASDGALRTRMTEAAQRARVPVLFVQAENDFDTTPSLALAQEMRALGLPSRVEIFPASGTSARDGHAFCAGGANPAWGDTVLQFITNPPTR